MNNFSVVVTLTDILGGTNNFVELLQVQALYTLESHTLILHIQQWIVGYVKSNWFEWDNDRN